MRALLSAALLQKVITLSIMFVREKCVCVCGHRGTPSLGGRRRSGW